MLKFSDKKAQTDIMGLVIIVIIIIIGIFFLVFSSSKKIDFKQNLQDSQMAQSFLNSLMKSNTNCGVDLIKVVQDCYDGYNICGTDSCDYASEKINYLFNSTLKKWEKPYNFYAKKGTEKKIQLNYDNCDSQKKMAAPGQIVLPSDIVVTLELCQK